MGMGGGVLSIASRGVSGGTGGVGTGALNARHDFCVQKDPLRVLWVLVRAQG